MQDEQRSETENVGLLDDVKHLGRSGVKRATKAAGHVGCHQCDWLSVASNV